MNASRFSCVRCAIVTRFSMLEPWQSTPYCCRRSDHFCRAHISVSYAHASAPLEHVIETSSPVLAPRCHEKSLECPGGVRDGTIASHADTKPCRVGANACHRHQVTTIHRGRVDVVGRHGDGCAVSSGAAPMQAVRETSIFARRTHEDRSRDSSGRRFA
jgi:hypothetical protein